MISTVKRAVFGALAVCGATLAAATPAQAQYWQCVTYARSITGIQIFGNANTWWGQAAGKYARGSMPKVGAVLALKPHGKMRVGHVAMVSRIISDREILLTHANWSVGGRIERDVRAIDVSAAGDWSKVKVWYAPMGGLGISEYPAFGFIYQNKADGDDTIDAPKPAKNLVFAENRMRDIGSVIDGLRN